MTGPLQKFPLNQITFLFIALFSRILELGATEIICQAAAARCPRPQSKSAGKKRSRFIEPLSALVFVVLELPSVCINLPYFSPVFLLQLFRSRVYFAAAAPPSTRRRKHAVLHMALRCSPTLTSSGPATAHTPHSIARNLTPLQLKRARLAAEARKKKEEERVKQQVRSEAKLRSVTVTVTVTLQSLARIQCAVRQKTARAVFKLQRQQHAGAGVVLSESSSSSSLPSSSSSSSPSPSYLSLSFNQSSSWSPMRLFRFTHRHRTQES
jgi:hypothetical protein